MTGMFNLFKESHEAEISKFKRKGADFRRELESYLENKDTQETTLHLYQIKAVLKVRKMLEKDPTNKTKPCLIVAPTGAGKSGIITMLPYVLESRKVLILTPSAIISNQLAEAFGYRQDKKNCFFKDAKICQKTDWLVSFLEDVTLISSSKEAVDKAMGNLVIVNAQKFGGKSNATLSMKYRNEVTIKNVETFFAQFDTLIVDEAHHYPASTWKLIVDECKKPAAGLTKKIIFLTATPYKVNAKGEKDHVLGESRTAYTIKKKHCFGSSIRKPHFSMNRTRHQEYMYDIFQILTKQGRKEHRFIPQAMVLASGRDEVCRIVEELNSTFNDKEYAVGISGTTKHIAKALNDFTAGKHRVAVTCKVGLEGYDNTRVTLCVIMRKIVTGRIMFSQFVGRCMRIRRDLPKIKGEHVDDRSTGRIISYRKYEQETLRREYESMDENIASSDPCDESDEEE